MRLAQLLGDLLLLLVLLVDAHGQHVERQDLGQALKQAVAQHQEGQRLVVSGVSLEGNFRAWLLPGECYGAKPSDCRAATLLDYELKVAAAGEGWKLSIQAPPSSTQGWHHIQSLAVWCGDCNEGSAGEESEEQRPLATIAVGGARKPCPFGIRHSAPRSSVALVLSEAWLPAPAAHAGTTSEAGDASSGGGGGRKSSGLSAVSRKLLDDDDDEEEGEEGEEGEEEGGGAVPSTTPTTNQNCMLQLGSGTSQSFDSCTKILGLDVYWSVLPAANGGKPSQLLVGLSGPAEGQSYIAVGFPSRPGRMTNADAFILSDCSSCSSGAKIEGYYMGSTSRSDVNPPARLKSSKLTAFKSGSKLSGSFVVDLGSSKLSAKSLELIYASGPLNSAGEPLQHFREGGSAVPLKAASVSSGSSGSGSSSSSPVGGSGAGNSTAGGQAGGGDKGTATGATANTGTQSCTLKLGGNGASQSFDSCTSEHLGLSIYWSVLPAANGGKPTQLLMGLSGPTEGQNYIAVGFPSSPGQMANSDAFILSDCSSCSSGAKIEGYYMSSTSRSDVNPPARLKSSNLTAAKDGSKLSGTFVVDLGSSKLSAKSLELIYASGPLNSAGEPLQHFREGGSAVTLKAASASSGSSGSGSSSSPPGGSGSGAGDSAAGGQAGGGDKGTVTGGTANTGTQKCTLKMGGNGASQSFDSCTSEHLGLSIYWSVLPAANGGEPTQLLMGLSGPTEGQNYIAVGFPSRRFRMTNADAFVVSDCSSCPSGAKIQGYYMTGTDEADVNPPARLASSNLTAAKEGSTLAGAFVVELDPAKLSAPTLNIIYAVGPLSRSGSLQQHFREGGSPVPLTQAATGGTTSSSGGDGSSGDSGGGEPEGETGDESGAPSPSTLAGNGTQQNCVLELDGASQTFSSCATLSGVDFQLMWQVLPASASPGRRLRQSSSSGRLQVGFSGATDGQSYIAVGFPSSPGRMTNADAFILSDCGSCASGASLQGYYMSGTSQSDVSPPSQLAATNITAAKSGNLLLGSFVVELDAATLGSPTINLIFARGPISGSGQPEKHDVEGDADIPLQGGSVTSVSVSSSNESLKSAHAWIMAISWGVMIPLGIVMARNFKELDPFWFKFHRAMQSLAFVAACAGFGLGFAIRGEWETPYTVHRDLGISTMALACMQMTALLYRPLKSQPIRRYWNWAHWWLGRAATAIAIANIYYGILKVDDLGMGAWASYTAVLGLIVLGGLLKESSDCMKGRKEKASEEGAPNGGQFIIDQATNDKLGHGSSGSALQAQA